MQRRHHLYLAAAWVLTLIAAAAIYAPGLHGPFLFDDFGSLPALGATGPVDHWRTFLRYITSGHADPTGRPLTLLTFLLDARDWPASPLAFKRTNLILHLLNGSLLAWLLWRLGRIVEPRGRRAPIAALLGAALWLLHPLLVSTTLYIVQREAMLPATFVMAGLIAWLHGRQSFRDGRNGAGTAWLISGLGLCTGLAVLSKANGALLPLLALVIEYGLLRETAPLNGSRSGHLYRRWMMLLAWVPAVVIVAFLVKTGIDATLQGLASRPWTEVQRLLTEPRVLMAYLGLLWVPRPFSTGLFNDAFPVSESIWHPWTTLPALLLVAGIMVTSWRLRRRHPVFAASILFFFAGQLMESTTIPLELYFEHRNYLPALLMFWPLAWWLADWRSMCALKISLSLVFIAGLGTLTLTRARIWGNAAEQALLWARVNPTSPRAQAYASQFETKRGHPQAAIRRLTPLLAKDPSQVQLAFNLISARCASGGLAPGDIATAERAMSTTSNPSSLLTSWFERAIAQARAHSCPGLDMSMLRALIEAGLTNPRLRTVPGRMQDLHYLLGLIDLVEQHPQRALDSFSKALAFNVRPGFAANAAAVLGSSGFPRLGLSLLDRYQRISMRQQRRSTGMNMNTLHTWVLDRQHYWPDELDHLRATLEKDAKRQEDDKVPQ